MTTSSVIDKLNRLKPNTLTEQDIIDYINEVECEVQELVLGQEFVPVTLETKQADLSAPKLYERVYFNYVASKIDHLNGDMESYSLTSEQFNADFQEMKRYCLSSGLTPLFNSRRSDYF